MAEKVAVRSAAEDPRSRAAPDFRLGAVFPCKYCGTRIQYGYRGPRRKPYYKRLIDAGSDRYHTFLRCEAAQKAEM